jgi:LPXTG-motif cell wall-anchored protein
VLRRTGVGRSARISRRAGLAGIAIALVCAFAASAALADRRPPPNADELWRSYPLEQKAAKTAPAPAASRRGSPPAADRASDTGSPWPVLAAIGVASALLVGLVAARRRRRPAVADGHAPQAAPPGPDTRAEPAAPAAARAAAAAAAAPVAARVARGQAPPRDRPQPSTGGAAGANRGRAAARGPVCQIRWNHRGRWFYAATVDADGAEQRLGRSPVVDWDAPGPPEETPEARAALRRLAKDLRERGWRPLRARGIDFDERRWYARRFRWPTAAEIEAAGADEGSPSREVAARRGRPT